jgi:7-keto-8-aminopelargonate synthetase-like enzyme
MTEEKVPIDAGAEGAEAPPAAPPAPPKPGGMKPRPNRPPPPPPPSKPSKLKGYLMLGIILSCVVLSGMVAYKIWKYFQPHKAAVNIEVESKDAFKSAEDAQKEIFRSESKVWIMGDTLTAATAVAIGDHLEALRKSDERMKDLFDLMHLKKAEASSDWDTLVVYSLQVKLWILDASDLLDAIQKPEYGGLYIPMYRTMDSLSKAQKELKEIKIRRDELLAEAQADPAVRAKTRARIQVLAEKFTALRDKLNELNDYIKKGLAREDLSPKIIKELDELREEASKAQMGFTEAGRLKQEFRE